MRHCEFKKRYDTDMDMYVVTNINGEGVMDIFKSVGKKLFGKTAKSVAKSAANKAATEAAIATSEYASKKAGDKIVELLSKNKSTTPSIQTEPTVQIKPKELTDEEVQARMNQILSGGKLRRRIFI